MSVLGSNQLKKDVDMLSKVITLETNIALTKNFNKLTVKIY